METLLVFLAIAAIQMLAAYAKQKKEAAKKEAQKYVPPPPQATEPIPDPFRKLRETIYEEPEYEPEPEFEKEPELEQELESEFKPLHASYADTPPKAGSFAQRNSQLSIINYQLNLKKPAQGILWTAILQEPRYKVKWKRR